jgi:hypothetical protein
MLPSERAGYGFGRDSRLTEVLKGTEQRTERGGPVTEEIAQPAGARRTTWRVSVSSRASSSRLGSASPALRRICRASAAWCTIWTPRTTPNRSTMRRSRWRLSSRLGTTMSTGAQGFPDCAAATRFNTSSSRTRGDGSATTCTAGLDRVSA